MSLCTGAVNRSDALCQPFRHTAGEHVPVLGVYGTIVDVGGGDGTFLANVMAEHPNVRGVLLDSEVAVNRARSIMREQGVEDRSEGHVGNLFEKVPEGGDLYILCSIIHDWCDADSVKILKMVREAMSPQARLLIVGGVLGLGASPSP